MNNNIEVIGIDHGWSQMKTSNTCFNTSIKELANVIKKLVVGETYTLREEFAP